MYRSLLVPLDGSPLAERAIPVATALAHRLGAEVQLLHVHERSVVDELQRYGVTGDAARSAAEQYLTGLSERIRAQPGMAKPTVTTAVVDGAAASVIAAHGTSAATDLIVMASHGRTGASRFWLGSVADAVMRTTSVPVLMVRGESPPAPTAERGAFSRVLVPLDGSAVAEEVIPHAIAIAKLGAAHVHLLRVEEPAESLPRTVWQMAAQEPDDLPERLQHAERDLHSLIDRYHAAWAPAVPSAEARAGRRVGDTITAVAAERGTDLIAMTTHGRGASRLAMGSVADKVLRGTTCAVFLLRSRLAS